MSAAAEPAIKSYFFGKGYRDLGATIRDSWSLNISAAGAHLAEAGALLSGEYPEKAKAVVLATAGLAMIVFGTVFFVAASTVHIVVLASFFALIYVAFTVVLLLERCVLLIKGYFTVCPHCHEKFDLPEYLCPGCGATHRRLIPSSYGILRRTCRCGTKLPATFFLNRGVLSSRCSRCGELLEQDHLESRKLFVPIVGGPSVGKSAFLYTAAQSLLDCDAARLGLTVSFVEKASEGDLAQATSALAKGRPPAKTVDTSPRAFNLKLDGRGAGRLIYLYDPAGEAYDDMSDLVLHRFHEYFSGIVFLVDPFSIPAVRTEYQDRLPAVEPGLKPSRLPATDAMSRVLVTMEEHFGLSKMHRIGKPLALVLNKVDAFDLGARFSDQAVQRTIDASTEPIDRAQARRILIREQLLRWDQADLVHQLETRFARVGYFACSAFGRIPDLSGRPFEPEGVMEPLMWILGDSDRVFRLE